MEWKVRGIVICVLAAAAVAPAAEWVTVEPDADAYVYYDYTFPQEDENFGGEPDLYAWDYQTYYDRCRTRSFIHFDFDGLDPAGQVLEAVLSIYIFSQTPGIYPIYVYRCADAWDEFEITWNNQPHLSALLGSWSEIFPNGRYSDVVELDAEEMEDMVDNPDENFGIVVYAILDGNRVKFTSREGGNPPQLKLLFSGADVQGASWGQIKAAF